MRPAIRVVIGVAVGLSSASVHATAYVAPPTIALNTASREVKATAAPEGFLDVAQDSSTKAGPFVETVLASGTGLSGSTAVARAFQETTISNFSIRGEADVFVVGSIEQNGFSDSSGAAFMVVEFMVPVNAEFSLQGTVDSSIVSSAVSTAFIRLTGTEEDGTPVGSPLVFSEMSQSAGSSGGKIPFMTFGTFKANTRITLEFGLNAMHFFGPIGNIDARASIEFDFDLGDRDGDGLLDVWEDEGIDIGGDGSIEIDLPAMGADPDHKDLFVEVDVLAGESYNAAAIGLVEDAFSNAPQELVKNPDGLEGIWLHVIWNDGDAPTATGGDGNLVDPLDTELNAIKLEYFGSPLDRTHPSWDLVDGLRQAREQIFRYCLWANTITSEGALILGIAELPGNDLAFAGGTIEFTLFDTPYLEKGIAGVFMHELGHNLNLRHGGTDAVQFKPNYLSVMNYSYTYPLNKITPQGTNAAEVFYLDYSRKVTTTLDETQLNEGVGVNGPPGRKILFNSVPIPSSRVITIGRADSPTVDWNNNGGPPDLLPYQLDISRLNSAFGVEWETLRPSVDWNRLWYNLSGATDFNDRIPREPGSVSSGFKLSDIQDMLAAEWFDQTALTIEIFWDDFESGDLSAWSSTVQ